LWLEAPWHDGDVARTRRRTAEAAATPARRIVLGEQEGFLRP
jgi:hypothetical protein